jgi:2-isopropylmalate synthase
MDEDNVVHFFDTTLRDGEQSPGATMSVAEKVAVAQQLDCLGVDVIEAGFAAASPGDFEAVGAVAKVVRDARVAALARCVRGDIEAAAKALELARYPVIHVFIATSDIHLRHKLNRTRAQVLEQIAASVTLARQYCATVEFSAEDATRSDWDFLVEVCTTAVDAGACVLNLPDTVGYSIPEEYSAMFRYVRARLPAATQVTFSAHCHNDLGLATANTLAAIAAGARQVEVTINGIGERAGNAALEEVVMALVTRRDALGDYRMRIRTEQLVPTSRLVSQVTGLSVQVNKAIVGANAFAHEAGIHQDGVIKERTTYEIMRPEDVGWESSRLVLGKHSGRHGMAHRLQQLGMELTPAQLDLVYAHFIQLADRKKAVTDEELISLAARFALCEAEA